METHIRVSFSFLVAVICTRTDEEILRDMRPEIMEERLVCFKRSWPERMKSLAKNGHMFSFDEWLELIRWYVSGNVNVILQSSFI